MPGMGWDRKSYRKSQKAEIEASKIGPGEKQHVLRLKEYHRQENIPRFEDEAQELINSLNTIFSLPPLKVKIKDAPRAHWRSKRWGTVENYGYYYGKTISIYARTPRRRQITAFRTLASTVLHEWMHHYDRHLLKIESYHTTGFFHRLNQLRESLGV